MPGLAPVADAAVGRPVKPVFMARGVNVVRRGRPVLVDLTVRINPGETVGVLGDRESVAAFLTLVAGPGPKISRGLVEAPGPGTYLRKHPLIPGLLTGTEWVRYRAALTGRSPVHREELVRRALKLAGLGPRVDARVAAYTEEEVATLALAVEATVPGARLVIDRALDTAPRRTVTRLARALWVRTDLAAVVTGSDGVVERVAGRIIILEARRVVFDGRAAEVMKQRVLEIEVGDAAAGWQELATAFPGTRTATWGLSVPLGEHRSAADVLLACRQRGIRVVRSDVRSVRHRDV